VKLTKRLIDGIAYQGIDGSRDVRWDDEIPGFGVRVYPNAKKSFVLSYRVNGRKRLMVLGAFGALTLEQARKLARRYLVSVIDGVDPLEKRRKDTEGNTVRDLADVYMRRHAIPHKKTWKDDERRIQKYILPIWRNLKVSNIGRADVAALHARIGNAHPYEANRVLELLSKMFELARRWGYLEENAVNPARDVDKFKEAKRDRWVTPEEVPRLVTAINQEKNPYVRAAIWLYLLTGLRKSELLRAKWTDVDWAREELKIPDTKAGHVHYVPLSGPALAMLRKTSRLEGNEYILPGRNPGGHLINIHKPWHRIRARAELRDVRLHDLRRTVGSWLAQSGNSLHLIGKVLNHSSTATTAVYARFAQSQVKVALEEHARRVVRFANK
jgi:integrase